MVDGYTQGATMGRRHADGFLNKQNPLRISVFLENLADPKVLSTSATRLVMKFVCNGPSSAYCGTIFKSRIQFAKLLNKLPLGPSCLSSFKSRV